MNEFYYEMTNDAILNEESFVTEYHNKKHHPTESLDWIDANIDFFSNEEEFPYEYF